MKKFLLCLTIALCLLIGTVALAETYGDYTQEEFDALEVTTVIADDDSPTGYYVTFRYKDPDATRVRIYGEWAFSSEMAASFTTSEDKTPEEWEDGDVVWTTGSWPYADMTLNEETGVWSYTIPLPTGTWNYRYYIGGVEGADVSDTTDAVMAADPANVNYLADASETGGEQLMTSIYVPYDEEKQALTIERAEEAPRDSENGTVVYESFVISDELTTTAAIYLPYGYDADREEAYPILVLFHGGGGYYGSWFSNGLANILDNMIAEGRLEPTIVVTPDGTDFAVSEDYMWDRAGIKDYIVDILLPYMAENYNASDDPAYRAMAGLSMGGATTAYMMFNATDEFDTYILLSAPVTSDIEIDSTIESLSEKTLFIGYGDYDFVVTRGVFTSNSTERSTLLYIECFNDAGADFTSMTYPYGHSWALWRKLIVDVFDNVLWK